MDKFLIALFLLFTLKISSYAQVPLKSWKWDKRVHNWKMISKALSKEKISKIDSFELSFLNPPTLSQNLTENNDFVSVCSQIKRDSKKIKKLTINRSNIFLGSMMGPAKVNYLPSISFFINFLNCFNEIEEIDIENNVASKFAVKLLLEEMAKNPIPALSKLKSIKLPHNKFISPAESFLYSCNFIEISSKSLTKECQSKEI